MRATRSSMINTSSWSTPPASSAPVYASDDKNQMDQLITDASALLHEPAAVGTK